MSSTEAQRADYRRALVLRLLILTTGCDRLREALQAEVDRIEEELGAAYALYVEGIYPFDPLPFPLWIAPPSK